LTECLRYTVSCKYSACTGLTSVTIPNSVTSIVCYAFQDCTGLTSVTIGSGIKCIYDGAFANCPELTDVYCYATSTPSILFIDSNTDIFDGSYIEYATLHVPEEAIDSYKATEPWSRFKTFVSVTDDNEFYEMTVSVAGSHGTVAYGSSSVTNGTQTFSVKEGTDVVLTVTPDEGYQLTSLTVNGTERKGDVSGGSLTLSSITGDIAVVAKFGAAGNAQQITIGASGMATFCSDSDLDFSTVSGLQAYTGAGFNRETGVLTMLRVSDVPAGTGLVLRGTPGTYEVPYGTSASIYANLLVGVTTATTLSQTEGDYTNYILSNGSHGVGFYIVSGTGQLSAGKAYLRIPTAQSSNLSRIMMDFDSEATGIENVQRSTESRKADTWYDLSGRRIGVRPTRKGLYIRNGQKVAVR